MPPGIVIVSGGQTGVDRAALDVVMERGMPCGGWCPAGRQAEDGPIDPRYPLRETPSADPAERMEWNVRDFDGTLLLVTAAHSPGTELTQDVARRLRRRCARCGSMHLPIPTSFAAGCRSTTYAR